ncbi:MAG TPA: hypothetical protein VMW34_01145 [Anaerolineales bacterium]|jgi:hypothetical protein|nr:hypothetical protein [Anaerolineales bacterium]
MKPSIEKTIQGYQLEDMIGEALLVTVSPRSVYLPSWEARL